MTRSEDRSSSVLVSHRHTHLNNPTRNIFIVLNNIKTFLFKLQKTVLDSFENFDKHSFITQVYEFTIIKMCTFRRHDVLNNTDQNNIKPHTYILKSSPLQTNCKYYTDQALLQTSSRGSKSASAPPPTSHSDHLCLTITKSEKCISTKRRPRDWPGALCPLLLLLMSTALLHPSMAVQDGECYCAA